MPVLWKSSSFRRRQSGHKALPAWRTIEPAPCWVGRARPRIPSPDRLPPDSVENAGRFLGEHEVDSLQENLVIACQVGQVFMGRPLAGSLRPRKACRWRYPRRVSRPGKSCNWVSQRWRRVLDLFHDGIFFRGVHVPQW